MWYDMPNPIARNKLLIKYNYRHQIRNAEITPTSPGCIVWTWRAKISGPFLKHALINLGSTFPQTKGLYTCQWFLSLHLTFSVSQSDLAWCMVHKWSHSLYLPGVNQRWFQFSRVVDAWYITICYRSLIVKFCICTLAMGYIEPL